MIFVVLYVLAGVIIHNAWVKTEQGIKVLNDYTLIVQFIVTLINISIGPIMYVYCILESFMKRRKK